MVGTCDACDKSFGDPKILGTRRYCPWCGNYLGTTRKPEKPNLPHTWWRTRTGGYKEVETPKTDPPKAEDYNGKSKE